MYNHHKSTGRVSSLPRPSLFLALFHSFFFRARVLQDSCPLQMASFVFDNPPTLPPSAALPPSDSHALSRRAKQRLSRLSAIFRSCEKGRLNMRKNVLPAEFMIRRTLPCSRSPACETKGTKLEGVFNIKGIFATSTTTTTTVAK